MSTIVWRLAMPDSRNDSMRLAPAREYACADALLQRAD
jgi:hypothetical protein